MEKRIEFSESTEEELKNWQRILIKNLEEKRIEYGAIESEVDKLERLTRALSAILTFDEH